MKALPQALSPEGSLGEELDPHELAEIFEAFGEPSGEQVLPTLVQAFQKALPKADLQSCTAVLHGMVLAKFRYPTAWKMVGEYTMRRCARGDDADITELAFVLESAEQKVGGDDYAALKEGLALSRQEVPEDLQRKLAWSCAEVGLYMSDVL